MYARVSSAEQEKEGFSIPAQQKLIREYASQHDMSIETDFVDVETAKRAGRPGFSAMMQYLKKHPSIRGILVE
ncbi:MAG: recombinase family protein, partial [Sphingobium limneticum]